MIISKSEYEWRLQRARDEARAEAIAEFNLSSLDGTIVSLRDEVISLKIGLRNFRSEDSAAAKKMLNQIMQMLRKENRRKERMSVFDAAADSELKTFTFDMAGSNYYFEPCPLCGSGIRLLGNVKIDMDRDITIRCKECNLCLEFHPPKAIKGIDLNMALQMARETWNRRNGKNGSTSE